MPAPEIDCYGNLIEFCAITPTRGDRPEFLEFCKHQVSRMTLKPAQHYIVDYKPKDDRKDLVERIRTGIELAKHDGFNFAFVMEDDDYYPADYFSRMWAPDYDFIGDPKTIYYHISSNGCQIEMHPYRASLFTTGFRISALDKFNWPDSVFVDIELWRYAQRMKLKRLFCASGAIGIKHGLGLCGGKGHRQRYKQFDENFEWLSAHIDDEALYFYKTMQKKLL